MVSPKLIWQKCGMNDAAWREQMEPRTASSSPLSGEIASNPEVKIFKNGERAILFLVVDVPEIKNKKAPAVYLFCVFAQCTKSFLERYERGARVSFGGAKSKAAVWKQRLTAEGSPVKVVVEVRDGH